VLGIGSVLVHPTQHGQRNNHPSLSLLSAPIAQPAVCSQRTLTTVVFRLECVIDLNVGHHV
jgi:hypothetical protein